MASSGRIAAWRACQSVSTDVGSTVHVSAVAGSVTVKCSSSGLLGEHHAERAVVALLGPAHVAGVGDVAQRDGDLQHRPDRGARPTTDAGGNRWVFRGRFRPPDTHRSSKGTRRGQSGAKKIVVAAIITHGNTPMANSRHVSTWNTTRAT